MPVQQTREVIETLMEVKHVKGAGTTEVKYTLEVANILKVLGELLNAIGEAMKKAEMYGSLLLRIESEVESSIRKIRESKQVTYHVNEETKKLWQQINEGEKLVQMCASETYCCCCFKKPQYTNELNDLDNSLERFCHQVVRTQGQEQLPPQADAGPAEHPGKNIRVRAKDSQVEEKPSGDMKDNKVKCTLEKKKGTHAEGKDTIHANYENIQEEEVKKSSGEIRDLPPNGYTKGNSSNSLSSVDGKRSESLRQEQSLTRAPGESGERNEKLVKLTKEKEDIRKEFECSDASEKTGLVSNNTTSSHTCLPLKQSETKGFGMLLNVDASSSIPVVLPKPNIGWDTFKKFQKDLSKEGVPVILSSTSIGFGEIAKAKELRQDGNAQGMQDLKTKLAGSPNIQLQ